MHSDKSALSDLFRVLALAGLALSTSTWASSDAALDLLEQMSQAGDSLNYSGEFVYVSEGKISSMKIAHMRATETRGSQQKLMSLDGSMREIIQQDDEVACVLPDQKIGVREKRRAKQLFKLEIGPEPGNITRFYDVQQLGQDRVANRDCTKLKVAPKDNYRYGYMLCIDLETQLLLSSELLAADDSVLESYRFVSVQFDGVQHADINSQTSPATLDWMDDKTSPNSVRGEGTSSRWRVSDNLAGFEQVHYIKRVSPVLQSEITHLVLSDGLAQVSVFVLPAELSASETGVSMSMGSLNSFTRRIDKNMVTVVGEVPGATVQLLAEHTQAYQ